MRKFAALFRALDQSSRGADSLSALLRYLKSTDDPDRLWAIALLTNKRPKTVLKINVIRNWAIESAALPMWLFEASQELVGDITEAIAYMLPQASEKAPKSLSWWMDEILGLKGMTELEQKKMVQRAWTLLSSEERIMYNKLLTGNFKMRISQTLITQALSGITGKTTTALSYRLTRDWNPRGMNFKQVFLDDVSGELISEPFPFYLAYGLDRKLEELGPIKDWLIERKWDGLRGQIIIRENQIFVWSRTQELITDKCPEYKVLLGVLPDGTVLDGTMLAFKDDRPLAYPFLQKRLNRSALTKKQIAELPLVFVAHDLLEYGGKDIRAKPLSERKALLEQLLQENEPSEILLLSDQIEVDHWSGLDELRASSRAAYCDGLLIKHKNSTYKAGRIEGDWWKWKVDPMSIHAVLTYAQRDQGGGPYTKFTFGVWEGDQLVTFAKCAAGLSTEELAELNVFIKNNTLERFGPVRSVKADLVFEISFEGIIVSSRHKSGLSIQHPLIKHWCKNISAKEANSLSDLKALLEL